MTELNDDPSAGRRMLGHVCHQIPERCFTINGRPMPLCARCTGFYIGVLLGFAFVFILPIITDMGAWPFFVLSFLLIIPMILDGTTQLFQWRKSTNPLRFTTGLLAGIGAGMLFGRIIFDIFAL